MDDLQTLIQEKDWKTLKKKYSPRTLAENLTFVKAMRLSRKLLENEEWDNDLQTYAINLIKSIKYLRSKEWNHNWKYDAYLGYAYDLRGWDYNEQFEAYNEALKKSNKPDPEILMRLAINWSCPGIYKEKMDEFEAIELLEKALKEAPYVEGIACLIDLYNVTGQLDKKFYWEDILKQSQKKQLHASYSFLDFFDEFV